MGAKLIWFAVGMLTGGLIFVLWVLWYYNKHNGGM